MNTYIEKEADITRVYSCNRDVRTLVTSKANVDFVPTELFGTQVYIDGQLQFSQEDEYRYHEMLVHPIFTLSHNKAKRVCILGGGDGIALHSVLKWNVEFVDLIDYDEEFVNYFSFAEGAQWNKGSLSDEHVSIHFNDIQEICSLPRMYDIIIMDLIDPDLNNELYRKALILAKKALNPGGSIVMNAGGARPASSKKFTNLIYTVADVFRGTSDKWLTAYKTFVPSFCEEWCFLLISEYPTWNNLAPLGRFRYFDKETWNSSSAWEKDWSGIIPRVPRNLRNYSPVTQI